ncbi:MAG: DEAD/DEAH box helicase, partial [Victivallales bacterium]|nr:DEAD/DEAH box helicase [Victivallales bacterium]
MKLLFPHCRRSDNPRGNIFSVPAECQGALLEALAEVAHVRWSARKAECPWRLHRLLVGASASQPWFVRMKEEPGGWRLAVALGAEEADIEAAYWQALGAGGWIMAGDVLYRIRLKGGFEVLRGLIGRDAPLMNRADACRALVQLEMDGGCIMEEVPSGLLQTYHQVLPTGELYVTTARFRHLGMEQLQCELSFSYNGIRCAEECLESSLAVPGGVIHRNPDAEEALRDELRTLGFRLVSRRNGDEAPGWKLLPSQLDKAVRTLVLRGWEVNAEGRSYRRPVNKDMTVSSFGIDWLEVEAKVDFGGASLNTPQLLQCARKGSSTVRLDDGTYGIIPQEWLEKFTVLTEIGECSGGKVRLRQEQAVLLQALLAEQLQDADGKYGEILARMERRREELTSAPLSAAAGFQAQLRPYQETALGWMRGLDALGLGGILADDMGLGKTVQVLALLWMRHLDSPNAPSLIVMPSSLLFNWQEECRRFAPGLKCGCYYGAGRDSSPEWFAAHDLVFTTYGTLRADAVRLSRIYFDYVILDESQAIKNSESATAVAARVLRARNRLAMTGTPIENHLSELFSQLNFLNPGLFSAGFVKSLGRESSFLGRDSEGAARLRHAVTPFILRRRKEQVARELPPRSEQTMWCRLEGEQLHHYRELQEYYREELAAEGGSAVSMLAALMKLRQAACHCGLVNPEMLNVPSAKLQMLEEQLEYVLEDGHKALVFSQFTSLLKLCVEMVEKRGWKYCYLDGQTRDRESAVRHFQEDEDTGIFFISLKAGGVGLNLTAADYVYILDPWWNPAAEAQAVDRAYRIGQRRPVMAYRMIAAET